MLYSIELHDMEFRAYHGCYDLEQKVGNRFRVGLKISAELGEVAQKDDVTLAVNYLTLYEIVAQVMQHKQRTIEAVAQNIIRAVKERFEQIAQVECRVSKLAPPLGGKVAAVSVTLIG